MASLVKARPSARAPPRPAGRPRRRAGTPPAGRRPWPQGRRGSARSVRVRHRRRGRRSGSDDVDQVARRDAARCCSGAHAALLEIGHATVQRPQDRIARDSRAEPRTSRAESSATGRPRQRRACRDLPLVRAPAGRTGQRQPGHHRVAMEDGHGDRERAGDELAPRGGEAGADVLELAPQLPASGVDGV